MRLNPFMHLIESKKYKYARLIRSSFLQRVTDTFFVFYGGWHSDLGILDYFFPYGRICQQTAEAIGTSTNSVAGIGLTLIFLIPSLLLNLVKLLAASALTLSVIPVISVVHLIFKSIWRKMASQIKNLTIYPINRHDKIESPNATKKMKLMNLKNFSFKQNIVRAVTPQYSYDLKLRRYYPYESVIYLAVYYAEYSTFLSGSLPTNLADPDNLRAIIEVNSNNWQGILAMLKTNAMWAATNLEDNSMLPFKDSDPYRAIEEQLIPHLPKHEFIRGMSHVSRNNSPIKKFVESPIYHSKLSALIIQFAGFHNGNNLIEKVRLAEEERARIRV